MKRKLKPKRKKVKSFIPTWTTLDGREIQIDKLSNEHLVNIIFHLSRIISNHTTETIIDRMFVMNKENMLKIIIGEGCRRFQKNGGFIFPVKKVRK